jgi:hypothetical protein
MVLCLVAAIVFGVMSIFSASYRPLAREGFRCAFRMLTFKKCDVHLEEKLKAGITGRLMMYHPAFASKVYHNFKALSWVFTIVFFASMIYTGYAAYNIVTVGTCDPAGGQCIFVPSESTLGSANVSVSSGCIQADAPGSATPYFDNNATVLFFYRDGCMWCQKEQEVLTLLAKDGYRVKPMHLDLNPEYWDEYGIKATPTFIGPDGKKMIGYQEYMPLRALLDSYK